MIHPSTRLALISQSVGVGVVATEMIPVGTVVWVHDSLDTVLSNDGLSSLPNLLSAQFRKHAYLRSDDRWMLCWDIARFVNHSCNCNVVVSPAGFEIACRDIEVGEQFTNEYGLFSLAPDEEFACACGALDCRGWISSHEVSVEQSKQQAKLYEAMICADRVNQPLWPLLNEIQQTLLKK